MHNNNPPAEFGRYLRPHEERQLLRTVRRCDDVLARRDYEWMRLLRHTGLRIGTLTGLTVGHADEALRTGYLTYEAEIAKRGIGGRIYLNRQARAAIKGLLKIRREMGHANVPDAPLVMSRKRRGLSVRSCQARMRQWVEAAGLDVAATPHWFRHTLAKRILATSTAREPLRIVQAALGHRNISSTAVYTRPDRDEVARAIEEAG